MDLDVPPSVEKIIRQVQAEGSTAEIESVVSSVLDSLRLNDHYALNIHPKTRYDVRNISVPVFDANHKASVVLSLVGFIRSLDGATVLAIAEEFKSVATRVSELALSTVSLASDS